MAQMDCIAGKKYLGGNDCAWRWSCGIKKRNSLVIGYKIHKKESAKNTILQYQPEEKETKKAAVLRNPKVIRYFRPANPAIPDFSAPLKRFAAGTRRHLNGGAKL